MASSVLVCGLDEAGRGPLAGPVTAGAVILPPDFPVEILNDSKKLSAKKGSMRKKFSKKRRAGVSVSLIMKLSTVLIFFRRVCMR